MTAPFPGRAAPRLNIGDAVHDGWQAFCRSPGAFVLFALLLWGLQVLFQLLQARIGTAAALSADPADWLLALVGLVGSLTSYFWGTIGMVRGALMGLEGRRPRFADLIRWDGGAITRLFWAALLLGALLLAALAAITVLLGGPLGLLTAMADARAGSLAPGLQLMTLVVAVLLLGVVILLLGWGAEALGLLLGAARLQASRWAYIGAAIGLVVGLLGLLPALPIGGPLLGALLGPLLGASLGELLSAPTALGRFGLQRLQRSLQVGLAVLAGMLVSRLAQVLLALLGVLGFVLLSVRWG